jgi:outer membrane lipoprotein-sorting protein
MAAPRSAHAPSVRAASAVVAILLLFSGAHASSQQNEDLFDEIYRRGQAFEQDLRTVKATFTETSTSRLLKDPLVARGILAVDRPTSRIALHYQEPEARTILIDGNTMRMEWPSRDLSEVGVTRRSTPRCRSRAHTALPRNPRPPVTTTEVSAQG